jgi:5-deoxy-5-amino-3-dehydroquinate synthase
VIGAAVRHRLTEVIARLGTRRAAIVSARPAEWLPDPGVPSLVIPVHDGEREKSLSNVELLCRRFARFGLTRSDVVVSCGGDSVTDLVGLAAALYHRGVAVIHVPTSLLAQVDASVGGQTGVNLPEGKNLLGAYWQPRSVLRDTEFPRTLPERGTGTGQRLRRDRPLPFHRRRRPARAGDP